MYRIPWSGSFRVYQASSYTSDNNNITHFTMCQWGTGLIIALGYKPTSCIIWCFIKIRRDRLCRHIWSGRTTYVPGPIISLQVAQAWNIDIKSNRSTKKCVQDNATIIPWVLVRIYFRRKQDFRNLFSQKRPHWNIRK